MNVVIYSAPGCFYCLVAKNFFKKNNIQFTEIDVSENPEKKKEMIKKSGQESVPVFEIGKEVLVGFDLKKIKTALGMD